jgi:hypothetical protein
MKTVYNYDNSGIFLYESEAFLDPLETKKQNKDVFLIPANSTTVKPIKEKDGFNVVFNKAAGKWGYEKITIPESETDKPYEPSEKEKLQQRIYELQCYLYDTDYVIIKSIELGEPVDDELKQKRQDARDNINRLREELGNYNA